MPKDRAQLRRELDRKIKKLSKAGKLGGKNLDRVLKRTDMLDTPKPKKAPASRTKIHRPAPTESRPPAGKRDLELLRQGFTAKELGIRKRRTLTDKDKF
jgi:hypothetical protein